MIVDYNCRGYHGAIYATMRMLRTCGNSIPFGAKLPEVFFHMAGSCSWLHYTPSQPGLGWHHAPSSGFPEDTFGTSWMSL